MRQNKEENKHDVPNTILNAKDVDYFILNIKDLMGKEGTDVHAHPMGNCGRAPKCEVANQDQITHSQLQFNCRNGQDG